MNMWAVQVPPIHTSRMSSVVTFIFGNDVNKISVCSKWDG